MRRYLLVLSLMVAITTHLHAQESQSLQFGPLHGTIKNETAYRTHSPTALTKLRNQLMLWEKAQLNSSLSFKVSGRAYYDAVYDGTHTFGANVESDQEYEAEIRDCYLDYSKGPFDLRLGKQQIVWGEAVGLFFADVVNARDLREFILPDFDILRIPQWGADLEYSRGEFHAELVWLPQLEFNKLGVEGSEFAFPYPVPQGTALTTHDPSEPKDGFRNSEVGVRLSYLLNGWDTSAFYLYTWERSPVLFRTISAGVYNFDPNYRRINLFGLTCAKDFDAFVAKSELLYSRRAYLPIFDTTDADGISRHDTIDYVIGADHTFGVVETNLQFIQRIVANYDKRLFSEERVFNALSLRLKRGFRNNTVEVEYLVIAGLMEHDLLQRPKISYALNDNWKVRVGADVFSGKSAGIFGKFEKKSRLWFELTYNF